MAIGGISLTYTLGALIAAQLFEVARRDIPGLMQAIAEGEFAPLLGWARERVHSKGIAVVDGGAGRNRHWAAPRDGQFRAPSARSLSELANELGNRGVSGDNAIGYGGQRA